MTEEENELLVKQLEEENEDFVAINIKYLWIILPIFGLGILRILEIVWFYLKMILDYFFYIP